MVAAEFVAAIKAGKLSLPINLERLTHETKSIIESYREKISSLPSAPKGPLKPTIILFQYVIDDVMFMAAYHFDFKIEYSSIAGSINQYIVAAGNYIKIGAIREKSPVVVDVIPESSLNTLRIPLSGTTPYETYLAVTEELLKIASQHDEIKIGGKTTTLLGYRVGKNDFKIASLKGHKPIMHPSDDNQWEDVSRYTALDLRNGKFFIRDMRKEGKLVSDIVFKDGNYIMRYDTGGHAEADDDIYFRIFSDFSIDSNMDIDSCNFEL
jgi:hypothetical protein